MTVSLASAMERALAASSPDEAWSHLSPFRSRIADDPEIASAWVTLLAASPSRPGAIEDASMVLDRFGQSDPALAAAAITALVRIDERRGLDEPPLGGERSPIAIAIRAAEPLLSALPAEHADDPDRGGALRIAYANALRRLGPARDADAVAAFERAIAAAPHAPAGWLYDLGLCHKWAGRFRAGLIAFEKAARELGSRRGLWFNIAICAVGAGESDKAADALARLGHVATVEPGSLPRVDGLQPVQVRLATRAPKQGAGLTEIPPEAVALERVWAQPLSPVHGVIRAPTVREAIADWGDVVLWDAAPVLHVSHEGRSVPVFPVLGALRSSTDHRFRFLAIEQEEGQLTRLALPEGVVLYPHSARVERLCARCAAGDVLTRHAHETPTEHRAVMGKLLVPQGIELATVRDSLERALAAASGVLLAVPGLYEALGQTQLAGKHHQRWGAIERGMQSRKTGA